MTPADWNDGQQPPRPQRMTVKDFVAELLTAMDDTTPIDMKDWLNKD